MILINHEMVVYELRVLSSESEQRRLWLSEDGKVSCFVETFESLFGDSCVMDSIECGETEFGIEVDMMLRVLEHRLYTLMDEWQSQEEAIADPRMENVRELASTILERILVAGSRNVGRITARVVEWQSEETQYELWLPATTGASPKSTPSDAAWHLFHGKDYWAYLEMGERRAELSEMFLELRSLVWIVVVRRDRAAEDVIADPRMRDIREMAARILRALEQV